MADGTTATTRKPRPEKRIWRDDEGPEFEARTLEYLDETEAAGRIPVMQRLSLHLGFKSPSALVVYRRKPAFADILEHALSRCEAALAERLLDKKEFHVGLIFCAKVNFHWNDGNVPERPASAEDVANQMAQAFKEMADADNGGDVTSLRDELARANAEIARLRSRKPALLEGLDA